PIVPIEETSKVSEENNVLKENIPETTILDKSVEEVSVLNENTTETEKLTENTEIISGEAQVKKKRKRRKNELAAIVADQLLESFKEVDKSRIDDLKMLENLAYEKSEDLLLTGMRLTPTTKRKQQSESLPATPTPQKKAVPRKKSQKEKPLETVKPTTKTRSTVIGITGAGWLVGRGQSITTPIENN
uniref:Uncharacterized protein n=1 Tax=Megaselia scalaris TaxID=36166 RepID=T1GCM4_MEGSC